MEESNFTPIDGTITHYTYKAKILSSSNYDRHNTVFIVHMLLQINQIESGITTHAV